MHNPCRNCGDQGWVCEDHRDEPFEQGFGTHCNVPGVPCPVCNFNLAAASFVVSQSGWRSIDSMPKDGTRFDVWVSYPGVEDGGYRKTNCFYHDNALMENVEHGDDDDGVWLKDYGFCGRVCNALFWRSLPRPPADKP